MTTAPRARTGSRSTIAAAAFLSLFAAAPAFAQDEAAVVEDEERGRIVTIGGGVQYYPRFPGDDDLGLNPMPVIGVRRVGEPITFEAPDEGWGFGLLGSDSAINVGPAIQFQGKRREEDVGAAVGEVDFTVEAGAFVDLWVGDNVRLRAEGRRGFFGHEGMLLDLGADFVMRDGDDYIFSVGPRLRLVDGEFMDTYFGVPEEVAAATGLDAYDPGGGLQAVGATVGLQYQLGGGLGLHAYARYDRLIGDAADSPIVLEHGSRHQWGAGLGLSYSFRVGG